MKLAPVIFASFLAFTALSETLELPPRPDSAASGSEFAETIRPLELRAREEKIFSEIMSGNVPQFLRKLSRITVTHVANGKTNNVIYYVTPDYLAIGSDEDYFLTPLTPFTAQKIADALGCTLPTRKMVNDIHSNALVKLSPSPIPPTPAMISVPVFKQHNEMIQQQRSKLEGGFLPGTLAAGHKKDVVISRRLKTTPGKVAIYGWHRTNGFPIQPLYLGHAASWADYSHGIRLIQKKIIVNGEPKTIDDVLADAEITGLLSDEGVISQAKYVFTEFPPVPTEMNSIITSGTNKTITGQFQKSPSFNEQTMVLLFDHGVRVVINAPSQEHFAPNKKMKLVFYGLPNGNTIEQTMGKQTTTNDDWHFDIQHIAAQTRFLREKLTNQTIVVAYLENSLKTWPAWRKKFGDKAVSEVVDKVVGRFEAYEPKIIFTGHSGGGSFTFGYLNCVEKIPGNVERIAFLDSNYAYETTLHRDKLIHWLQSSDQPVLAVLAYHDDIALLDGKTFVSAAGGTWGRSHLMKRDFETVFEFTDQILPEFKNYSALKGRLKFFLKENPEKKILHTVQVEKNGFIHAMLTGTPLENHGYEYFGERAYTKLIQPE